MTTKTCDQCGAAFDTSQPRARFCGRACSCKWYYLHPESTSRKAETCKACGREFVPKAAGRAKCCSRKCGFEYQRTHPHDSRRTELHGTPFKESWVHLWFHDCPSCGIRVRGPKGTNGACSDECRKKINCKMSMDHYFKTRELVPLTDIECSECGTTFTGKPGVNLFCSHRCANRDTRHRRRVRVPITETPRFNDVWHKFNGTCAICGVRCLRARDEYHPLMGTIDHIWPVTLLGQHSKDNLQLAHSICNSLKGERNLTERLRERCRARVNGLMVAA